jgi:dihydroorotase
MSSDAQVLVFRRVRAVDPAGALDAEVDVVIECGHIARLGRDAARDLTANERVHIVELTGAWLLPGFIDLHTHLREPGAEGKEDIASGLRAAAAGGFVDVCCMANTRPVNDSRVVTEMLVARARAVSSVRLHPIAAITVGQKGEQLTEMADLKDAGAVAVSDDGRCVTSSRVMRHALEYASTFDMPVIQHAEDHMLTEGAHMHEGAISTKLGVRGWPRVAEDVIVARDLLLAEYVGARYHVAHVSTMGSVRLLRDAKSRGVRVTAEVTPHHLLLTHEALLGYDTACKVNPPLREPEDVEALRRALADGTIDCIATTRRTECSTSTSNSRRPHQA